MVDAGPEPTNEDKLRVPPLGVQQDQVPLKETKCLILFALDEISGFISFQCFEVHDNLLHLHFTLDPVGFELSSVLCFHISICQYIL